MNKRISVLVVFILTLILSTSTVYAEEIDPSIRVEGMEEDDGTMWWRYAYWDTTDEFPSYVGYVEVLDDGETFEVGLVENTPENQQEIIDLVPQSADNIVFTEAEYARNEQNEFRQEIQENYMTLNSDFEVVYTWWNEDRLVLGAPQEYLEDYTDYFEETYGDQVEVLPEEEFVQEPVDWVGYYLEQLPPQPEYGTVEFVIYNRGEDDGTIDWRYEYWETTESYPDNIGFIRIQQDQVTWEIGLVENTPEAQQEILAEIPNSEVDIVFLDADYSYNELRRAQEEIAEEFFMQGEHPLYSVGVQSDRIVVTLDEEHLQEYTELFEERYGNMVVVEPGEQAVAESDVYTEESAEDSGAADTLTDGEYEGALPIEQISQEEDSQYTSIIILGAILVVAVFLFLWNKGIVGKRQLSNGHQVDDAPTLSKNEVETLIKSSGIEPGDKVYEAIMKETFSDKQT